MQVGDQLKAAAVTLWIEGCVGGPQSRSVWSGSRAKQFSLPSLELRTVQYPASRYAYYIIPAISHYGFWCAMITTTQI
jgi:hypothetical protein